MAATGGRRRCWRSGPTCPRPSPANCEGNFDFFVYGAYDMAQPTSKKKLLELRMACMTGFYFLLSGIFMTEKCGNSGAAAWEQFVAFFN